MRKIAILAALLLVAACGSVDLGSILGSASPTQQSNVSGTVNTVDTSNQRIDLDVS